MPRRVSLPAADELFRTTGGAAVQPSSPQQPPSQAPGARVPAPGGPRDGSGSNDASSSGDAPGTGAEHTGRQEPPRAPGASPDTAPGQEPGTQSRNGRGNQQQVSAARTRQPAAAPRRGRSAPRRPSGRERHDEKITVYVSAEELMDLEHARLVLRGEHGLAVDRGRIVREAVAVVLADLEARGDASILVRRLRGR